MKRLICAIVLVASASPAMALGGYFGIGFARATALDMGDPGAGTQDDTDTSLSAFLGYEFSRQLSGELNYVNLGKFTTDYREPGYTSHTEAKAHAISATLVGLLPFAGEFGAFGRAGVAFASVDGNGSDSDGSSVSASGSSTSPVFGIGLQYGFESKYLFRVEFDRYQDVGNDETGKSDFNTIGVSAAVRF